MKQGFMGGRRPRLRRPVVEKRGHELLLRGPEVLVERRRRDVQRVGELLGGVPRGHSK